MKHLARLRSPLLAALLFPTGLGAPTSAAAGQPIVEFVSASGVLDPPPVISHVFPPGGPGRAEATTNFPPWRYVHEPDTGKIRNVESGHCWFPSLRPSSADPSLYLLEEFLDEPRCTRWDISGEGTISTVASDGNKVCLELREAYQTSLAGSGEVVLRPCDGSAAQKWTLKPVGTTEAPAVATATAPDPNARDENGNTVLHRAVAAGEPDAKLTVYLAAGTSVDVANNAGETALFLAVGQNAESAVRLLLDAGANVNATNSQGATPLLVAVRAGDRQPIAMLLLDRGATPNDEVVATAVARKDTALIDRLMKAGVTSDKLLDLAVGAMDVDLASAMLAQGAKPTTGHVEKAVDAANLDLLDLLLGYGGDANVALARAMATTEPKPAVVKSALENGADGSAQMPRAVDLGSMPLATLLVDHGADPGAGMMRAIELKNKDMVRHLKSLGATLDKPEYAVYWAGQGDEDMTRFVLGEGGDGNAALGAAIGNKRVDLAALIYEIARLKGTPEHLEWAVHMSDEALVTLVLEHGVSPQAGMAKAIDDNNQWMIDLLVSRGADATPKELIVGAVKGDKSAAVAGLAAAGARVDWTLDDNGTTLLHYAASHCSATTGALLSNKADPNVRDGAGNTPLHLVAAAQGCKELVEELLAYGADVNATDKSGRTPLAVVNGAAKKKVLKAAGGI